MARIVGLTSRRPAYRGALAPVGRGRKGGRALQGGKLVSRPGGHRIVDPMHGAPAPSGRGGGGGGGLQIGNQLSRRVQSGAITEQQAERTAQQRQTLKKAFGPDWRQKVFGVNVGALRTGLAGKQSGNPRYQGAYKVALERRKKMLAAARAKISEGGQG